MRQRPTSLCRTSCDGPCVGVATGTAYGTVLHPFEPQREGVCRVEPYTMVRDTDEDGKCSCSVSDSNVLTGPSHATVRDTLWLSSCSVLQRFPTSDVWSSRREATGSLLAQQGERRVRSRGLTRARLQRRNKLSAQRARQRAGDEPYALQGQRLRCGAVRMVVQVRAACGDAAAGHHDRKYHTLDGKLNQKNFSADHNEFSCLVVSGIAKNFSSCNSP